MNLFAWFKEEEEAIALPVGLTEFHEWADKIIAEAGQFADEDSLKFAIASMIQHLDHQKAFMPISYFVNGLRKAAANQIAAQVFMDIKTKQLEAAAKAKAEEDAKQAAVTAQPAETPADAQQTPQAPVQA